MKLDIPKRFYTDRDWAWRHFNDLIKKYENTWVAIYKRKIISASDDAFEALETARRKTKVEKIPVVYIDKMSNVY